MRPKERRETGQRDLFRARLDQIVDLDHSLVKLARAIDWSFLEERFGAVYTDDPGRPPLPTRLMAGLAILKPMHDVPDELLCERWVENPYDQLFCGEDFFRHKLPFERSSLTRWRQRMGPAQGRGQADCANPGELVRRDPHRSRQARRLSAGGDQYDRAGEGNRLPDRRQADASGSRALGAPRASDERDLAPILCAGRQGRADPASALCPRQAVQAGGPRPAEHS